MVNTRTVLIALCCVFACAASVCRAQSDFEFTRTVDPKVDGWADFETIQEAIDDIDPDPGQRWTVLIYAGVYEETVTLANAKAGINLVGVDRDAVIIQPPLGQNGIIIDGVGARNNTIRNLTIHIRDETGTGDNLDGILIKRTLSGDDPSDITIENVTINLDADASRAIRAAVPVSDITIAGVTIDCTANAGSGIVFDDPASNVAITSSSITTAGNDGPGLVFDDTSSAVTITSSSITTAGERIADAITVLQGQTTAAGVKPINTVTKLIVQAGSGTVSVGTTDTLGLEFPIAGVGAVQQQSRMAAASTSYTIGSPGTVVASRSTVAVAPITTGDSLEWAARASE